jgi:hypothetical protein
MLPSGRRTIISSLTQALSCKNRNVPLLLAAPNLVRRGETRVVRREQQIVLVELGGPRHHLLAGKINLRQFMFLSYSY